MELATCDKYYEEVLKKWPELTERQLDKIIKHGLSTLYLYNLYGGDVLLKNSKFTMFFGKLFFSNLVFYKYWKIKWKIKLRIKYRKNKTKYDGYYYFGLTEKQYENYKSLIKSTGRRREKFTFENLFLYKILDECLLNHDYKHIFKLPYPEDCGFLLYKKKYEVRNFDYILKRNKDNTVEPVSYEQKSRTKHVNKRSNKRSTSI